MRHEKDDDSYSWNAKFSLVLETSMSGWKTQESLNCILTKYSTRS